MTPSMTVLLSLSLALVALRSDAADASGKVVHNGGEMTVRAAVAVFDASSGFLEVHLLEQPPPAEEMARLERGLTPRGRRATLMLYVAAARDRGGVAPPADEIGLQMYVDDIAGRNTAAVASPTPATLKGTLKGRIQPGEVITLVARDEASSDVNKKGNAANPIDKLSWDVRVKTKILLSGGR
jgi:hypothetical protein